MGCKSMRLLLASRHAASAFNFSSGDEALPGTAGKNVFNEEVPAAAVPVVFRIFEDAMWRMHSFSQVNMFRNWRLKKALHAAGSVWPR